MPKILYTARNVGPKAHGVKILADSSVANGAYHVQFFKGEEYLSKHDVWAIDWGIAVQLAAQHLEGGR